MNVHKDAVLTPRGREQRAERLRAGESRASAAAAVGVSRQTARKWEKRMAEEGVAGLQDRSSRPHRSPTQVRRVLERQVARLRRQRWTQAAIADSLGMALSTVGAVCRRLGLGRLPELERRPPIVRYERPRAGELIHLDIRKLARIERVGHRIHGDRSQTSDGAGWEFLHFCIDDASRVERVMTDNGAGHLSKVVVALIRSLGARHIRTRPYTPRTNGKAERFIQTCKREWAYARPYAHSRDRIAALDRFLCFYNCHRPHWGIGRKTPPLRLTELVDNLPGCYTLDDGGVWGGAEAPPHPYRPGVCRIGEVQVRSPMVPPKSVPAMGSPRGRPVPGPSIGCDALGRDGSLAPGMPAELSVHVLERGRSPARPHRRVRPSRRPVSTPGRGVTMATMFRKGCWNRGAICAATAMFAACSEPTSVAPEAATPDVAEAPGAGRDGGMLELERGDFRLLFPTAMNERGLVVGWASGDGPWRAVAWLDGKLSVLPALGPGLSRAADVNRRGVIVGSSTDALGRVRAVRWIDGRVEDLGVLPGGGEAAALGINDRGQIVGVSESAGELKGFLWDRGTMLPLEPGGGGTFAYAEAINNRGVVVGWAAGGVLTQGAMVWRDGVVEPLPTLAYESAALGINARGEIIGGSFPVYQTAARAVRWVDGLIEDLATPEGVRFTAANDINDRGEITGWGDGTGVVVWDDGRYRQVYPVGVGRAIDNRGNIAVSGDGVLGVLRRGGRGGEPAGPGTPGPGLSAPGTVGPPAAAGEVGRQGEGPGASGLCRRVPIMTPGLRATLELAGCVD